MKYYIFSVVLILFAAVLITFLPLAVNRAQAQLFSLEIPQKSEAAVAGIQKYNLPPVSKNIPAPVLSAKAVIAKDLNTGTILYQINPDLPLPIASTTKIMTAVVASEYYKPNSEITVTQRDEVGGSTAGLVPGEVLSFRSVLYGMLLNSGNDAAFSLADNYPGGILGFVSAMNKKAMDLKLQSTHFDNPAGFDSPNHYSSANDLTIITEEALKDSTLARIFATKETSIVSLDKKYVHPLTNLNKLLTQVKGVLGVKTGYTDIAKENLVTYVDRDDHKILTVVLGSDDRFGDSTKLIEWVYSNFTWSQSETGNQ